LTPEQIAEKLNVVSRPELFILPETLT